MITLRQAEKNLVALWNGSYIGTILLYDNPFHIKNCYVKLDMESLDTEFSTELFERLKEIANRSLQVMVDSDQTVLTEFLIAGGFRCKRKCYEVEAGPEDYIGGREDLKLLRFSVGTPNYEEACRMMFHHYVATHEAISPWTADYLTFCEDMPKTVICAKTDGEIVSAAFVEENEIAYVCGRDERQFAYFARALITDMLAEYGTVCFESDDCDRVAMILKSMFIRQKETSFDTYILR